MITAPFYLVEKFFPRMEPGVVLDIGFGDGRNSIFLARKGFSVEGIEIDEKRVEELERLARDMHIDISVQHTDVRDFDFRSEAYTAVLAIQSLVFLKKSEFRTIVERMRHALQQGGIAIVSSFTVDDVSYKRLSTRDEVEENTFLTGSGVHWQFLAKGELRECFGNGFDILHYGERVVEDDHHGDMSGRHMHGIAEIVAQKKRGA